MADDKARKELLEGLRKVYPEQIPAKELYQPDLIAKSKQGPMEVAQATFANCKIKHGRRHA